MVQSGSILVARSPRGTLSARTKTRCPGSRLAKSERNSKLVDERLAAAGVQHGKAEAPRRVEELDRCGELQTGGCRRIGLRATIPGAEEMVAFRWTVPGPRLAAIGKEARVSRSTVKHVITAARRDRRKTERGMLEGHSRTDMPRRLNSRAYAAKTDDGVLPACHRPGRRLRLAFGPFGRHRIGIRDETGSNVAPRDIEARSHGGLIDNCRTPVSLGAL